MSQNTILQTKDDLLQTLILEEKVIQELLRLKLENKAPEAHHYIRPISLDERVTFEDRKRWLNIGRYDQDKTKLIGYTQFKKDINDIHGVDNELLNRLWNMCFMCHGMVDIDSRGQGIAKSLASEGFEKMKSEGFEAVGATAIEQDKESISVLNKLKFDKIGSCLCKDKNDQFEVSFFGRPL